jgi:hypothetical protein
VPYIVSIDSRSTGVSSFFRSILQGTVHGWET